LAKLVVLGLSVVCAIEGKPTMRRVGAVLVLFAMMIGSLLSVRGTTAL
jgi:hypothetical protein